MLEKTVNIHKILLIFQIFSGYYFKYQLQINNIFSSATDTKGWDIFRLLPPPPDDIGKGFWHDVSLQVLKISCFFVLFFLTLISATVAKSSFLLMTSAVGWSGKNMTICNDKIPEAAVNKVRIQPKHVVKWVWAIYLSLCAPELICFVRSFHRTLFRNVKRPSFAQFVTVFCIETMHSIGVGIFVFRILPDLDAVTGAMLTNAMCLVPCVLSLISRKPSKVSLLLVLFDIACIAAQSSTFWAWPAFSPSLQKHALSVPITLLLISLAWWQNFIHTDSVFPPVRCLARYAIKLAERRSKTYVFVSLWKCFIYLLSIFLFIVSMDNLLQRDPFGERIITITGAELNKTQVHKFEMRMHEEYSAGKKKREADDENIYNDFVILRQYTSPYDALWIVLVQVLAAVTCYYSSKFACKVMMQRMGFALPIALSVPLTVFTLSSTCSHRHSDSCYMTSTLTKELFWQCYDEYTTLTGFMTSAQTWFWFSWLASQIWITIHLWRPEHERLAKSEKLFILSYFNGAFVDQSLAFNRRRDDKIKIRAEDLELDGEDNSTYATIPGLINPKPPPSVCSATSSKFEAGLIRDVASSADAVTKIYACATMWHESALEMTCMLKSVFRLDEDQCARRNAQKYLKVIDPDYYEFEAHIFFDDAFDINDYGEPVINKYVKQFIEKVDEAASAVHQTQMRLKTPKKTTTPYGGRISYVLPGKNRMTVHLKDKNKIRHRKRWSQVMYMYYLLGYRLMMKVDDQARKEIISENTFILTLDGDVDFTPQCVHLLVDLMKKNRRLGAACGRIHPRGSGLMVWYQKFEYAVGHWLQKATEHMIGCVLCSPGCFSLFRSYALMDDNVARRYASKSENPVDYIQYDQGEDRWLCTLLLQRGYRVEYCAASDALTYAPEGFNEFFNQRRRWIPSTLANIIDLLKDYKNVVTVNESISIWYIIYQCVMLVSSILGPGTIFLMIVGAISISFNIDTSWSLLIVSLPMTFFCLVCLVGPPDKQVYSFISITLLVAQIIGALFIQKDGILSPHSIFLFSVIGSFITAAILHPLEFTCVVPGLLYFLAIPCMYMLLPIYSLCNLNTVTWGTREEPKSILILVDGEFSLGCGSVWRLNEKLNEINRKLDKLERRSGALARRSSVLSTNTTSAEKWNEIDEDDQAEMDDNRDMSNQSAAAMRNRKWKPAASEAWLNERMLRRAERDYLDQEEETFWNDVIEKYLSPISVDPKEQDKLALHFFFLSVCSGFFMVNVVFIIIVLVLQLQKDCLHIEWPLGPKFNHTVMLCNSDIRKEVWVMTRLQLEPIGLVFLVFFMSILVIQFFAMLMHRFGTLAHIIASTELFCFRKPLDRLSEDELVVQNAVEIARELQAIKGVDEAQEECEERAISRRRVVQNLESSRRSMMKRKTETLDAAFKKRFFALSSENAEEKGGFGGREKRLTLRKGTIRALEQRRDSLFGTIDKRHVSASRGPAQRRLERLFNQQDAVSIENGTRGRCRQPNQQPQGSRQHNHDSNLDSRF
uniref:chitin synthase n=1 Tax=Syphacia muris TaxID=451379 RepID=A0A158R449_9BILA